jgi:polysaccharide biosynthesis transport protein
MNEKNKVAPPPGVAVGDILYVIFRHKWKILVISALGVIGALAIPFVKHVPYESEARLYVRYVMETRAPSQVSDTGIKSVEPRAGSMLITELETMTSFDLAQEVADAVGPDRILAKVGGGTNRLQAAGLIQAGLVADVPKDSSVIRLVFQHPDPEIPQIVLRRFIDLYFKKHLRSHAVGAFDEFLTQQTDQLRSSLGKTEEELRQAKAKLGVVSLEDTKKSYGDLSARIEQQILDAEAELAERRAAVKELAKLAPEISTGLTNSEPSTNLSIAVPSEDAAHYKTICNVLDTLRKREQELLLTFTPASSFIRDVREQIETNQKLKKQLEIQNPGLLLVQGASETNRIAAGHLADPEVAVTAELARVRGLESKVKVLAEQLDQIHKKATALDDAEGSITELQRRKGLQENYFTRFSANLEQSQIDEKLGAGKVSNISTIEEPTPPRKAKSKLVTLMGVVLFGGIGLAFGLAFLIEFYLDQSVRRPGEVETKIGLPLFIDVPLLALNGDIHKAGTQRLSLPSGGGNQEDGGDDKEKTGSGIEVVSHHHQHPLQCYYETLRDRLLTYFEMKNLVHKPKLVAVTSCAEGSGVSTIAAGLAASLSETGEGNVLLVNMKQKNGSAQHFHKGELACGLEEALEEEKRGVALVQDNLYVVSEGDSGSELPTFLPKRFKQLLPRLRASDFDCIIFDMPPVSQISITPRLARFMDVVLMVVEAGKTDISVAKKASGLLAEANPNIGIIMNKRREHLPRWLKQEI